MAHFAKVDENNLVTEVIVIDNSVVDPENTGTDNESLGQTYIADVLGFEGNWQQCSYNNNIRGHYAGVGYTWDEENDNIYLWDFYMLETEGELYLKPEYAAGKGNSHPNRTFSQSVAPLLCQRIVSVIEGEGDSASLTGERSSHPRPRD